MIQKCLAHIVERPDMFMITVIGGLGIQMIFNSLSPKTSFLLRLKGFKEGLMGPSLVRTTLRPRAWQNNMIIYQHFYQLIKE